MLAILEYPQAANGLINFLQKKNWGVTGISAAVLLTECDESPVDLVKSLLTHPQYKVRIQAALILALWGRDAEAIAVLAQAYPTANRDLKERILEGLGRIGDRSSIPFLTDCLNEPYPSLRVIAACALMQCLNH